MLECAYDPWSRVTYDEYDKQLLEYIFAACVIQMYLFAYDTYSLVNHLPPTYHPVVIILDDTCRKKHKTLALPGTMKHWGEFTENEPFQSSKKGSTLIRSFNILLIIRWWNWNLEISVISKSWSGLIHFSRGNVSF